jgi:hypothetical protein
MRTSTHACAHTCTKLLTTRMPLLTKSNAVPRGQWPAVSAQCAVCTEAVCGEHLTNSDTMLIPTHSALSPDEVGHHTGREADEGLARQLRQLRMRGGGAQGVPRERLTADEGWARVGASSASYINLNLHLNLHLNSPLPARRSLSARVRPSAARCRSRTRGSGRRGWRPRPRRRRRRARASRAPPPSGEGEDEG